MIKSKKKLSQSKFWEMEWKTNGQGVSWDRYVIHYVYESLRKYRSSRMMRSCVSVRNTSHFSSGCLSRTTAMIATRIDNNKQDKEKVGEVHENPDWLIVCNFCQISITMEPSRKFCRTQWWNSAPRLTCSLPPCTCQNSRVEKERMCHALKQRVATNKQLPRALSFLKMTYCFCHKVAKTAPAWLFLGTRPWPLNFRLVQLLKSV